MRFPLKPYSLNNTLAGASSGRQCLGDLLTKICDPPEPEPLFLDFSGIQVATVSFLREGILTFKEIVRSKRSNIYPIVANASDIIIGEFKEIVLLLNDNIISCDCDCGENVSNTRILGKLDPAQKIAFSLLQEFGPSDAAGLMAKSSQRSERGITLDSNIKQTAWNNRLAALSNKGLIIEIPRGRSKQYKLVFKGGFKWA